MEPQSGIKTWQWVVTVIVIIVLIVIGVLVFGGKGSPAPSTTSTSTPTDTTGAINRITMTDQYPGNVVYLNSVQLAQPGYVAIFSDNNGQPGSVIGYAHFDAGINPGKITLTQPMVDGKVYYAELFSDNGDGKFDPSTDSPILDANGNAILDTFHSTTAAGAGLKG